MSSTQIKKEPVVTAALAAEHGLKPDEYALLLEIVGRVPTITELGIYSVMWSEHCSYKSSRVWLKKLPTTAPWVICGPGENAGVIDIGDGEAAIFKMESHNHPSFIEPYQGAATGVGGILRDVFTMGARPVANLNALRFGEPSHPKTRHLVSGVVAGIGGYGNCVGVPTVGGETNFHKAYNGNCLVNAMTVGVAQTDKIFYSKAAGVGKPVVYVGSKTGRDGIHGATMSSAEFTEDSEAKRPTVQVGDPFTEKLLIEACLELMATDAIVAIQDMGAAGLTSSSVEMAGKGGLGIDLDLDAVPQRETGMTPYEIMLSESQERMLMILEPGREDEARRIFEKWELDFAVIGRLTDNGRMVLRMHGHTYCDLELAPLFDKAPLYNRPHEPTPLQADIAAATVPLKASAAATLTTLLGSPDLASRRWIWEQYDSQVGADTMFGPGGDAAVVRVHGSEQVTGAPKALAMTTDCTPRYCYADPVRGGAQAVVEAWRNLTAVGALPLAITDNMNFGNPEKPRIMGQFAGCIEGMADACRVLDFPVVSGNVSLYNETNGEGILPTPAIGGVGLLKDARIAIGSGFVADGDILLLLGAGDIPGTHVGQSLYLRDIHGREEGSAPAIDLAAERRTGDLVRGQIEARRLTACHDLSDGGLLVGIAEMALRGKRGVSLEGLDTTDAGVLFGEDQGRYLVTVAPADLTAVTAAATSAGVSLRRLGVVGGDSLTGIDGGPLKIDALRQVSESWLPTYMAGEV